MSNVYFLTPTGNRPEGMALLAEYVEAQTYQGDATWVIVDDCDPATHLPTAINNVRIRCLRPEGWRWKSGMNTQARCMAAGLSIIPDDGLVIVLEDDDCYLPGYVETMLEALTRSELVGERTARYYNVATGRFKRIPCPRHSSLASTALRGAALSVLRGICEVGKERMIDVALWRKVGGLLLDSENVISIKGLPGRGGIGVGHRKSFGDVDKNGVLELWAGEYAGNYEMFRRAS